MYIVRKQDVSEEAFTKDDTGGCVFGDEGVL